MSSIPQLAFSLHSPASIAGINLNRNFVPSCNAFLSTTPRRVASCKCSVDRRNFVSPLNATSPILHLQPHVVNEWKPILMGWSCGALSVYALSQLVPQIGRFSTVFDCPCDTHLKKQLAISGLWFLTRLITSYGQQTFLWEAALNSVYRMRTYVFHRVLQRDMAFFESGNSISSGDISYRITAEAADISDVVYHILKASVPNTLHLFAMASHMFRISPALSIISAMVIPCVAFVVSCLGVKLRKVSRRSKVATANLSSYLNEVFPSILFLKAGNLEACEHARFHHFANIDLLEQLKKKRLKSLIPQVVQIMFFGALSVLCVSCLVLSKGLIDGRGIVSFVTSLAFLIEPIQGMEKAYNEWKQVEPVIERLFSLTRFESGSSGNAGGARLEHVTGDLEFCDISFGYKDDQPLILDGLNLHIRAGETVAFVGPSGGGKTTLVKLLLRLYDPTSGSILMDGQDIRGIEVENLRTHIGLVSQDTVLFSGTVAENIGYRDMVGGIDMGEVEKAARMANADEFVRKLPRGYETRVGQRGSSLSGGQKQRIAIARALYQRASILVLDEATSALDSRSELLVRQAIDRVTRDHTVLVIAHRMDTVKMADRVFLLDRGALHEIHPSAPAPLVV